MKYLLLGLFFTLFNTFVIGQKNLKRDSLLMYDYQINPKIYTVRVSPIKISEKFKKNSIMVIDDKIYSENDFELNKLKIRGSQLIRVIADTNSNSGIRYIYIYKSKN